MKIDMSVAWCILLIFSNVVIPICSLLTTSIFLFSSLLLQRQYWRRQWHWLKLLPSLLFIIQIVWYCHMVWRWSAPVLCGGNPLPRRTLSPPVLPRRTLSPPPPPPLPRRTLSPPPLPLLPPLPPRECTRRLLAAVVPADDSALDGISEWRLRMPESF